MAAYKKIEIAVSVCALLLCCAAARAQETPKGHLFIIGGGDRTDPVLTRFVELAGGSSARIVIVPQASEEEQDAIQGQAKQFKRLGAASAEGVIFKKGDADKKENLAKFKDAGGVFFSGGDQVRLVAFLAGTKMLEEIRRIYREGGVVGGSSAGAAIMSKVMLTGDDRMEVDGESFTAIRSSSVVVAEGFGFLPPYIVADQHFLKRKRENRLISVVLEHPGLTGIGIDEATAFIVSPDGTGQVLGNSLVSVYETFNAGPITRDESGHLAARGITLHLLKSGDTYDLKKAAPEAAK